MFQGGQVTSKHSTLRDLPWRRTRDPWAILVSEVMLQQTQTSRVIPKWTEFMARYPTVQECASSSLGDVLRLWQGLGYPRRAQNLHAAAVCIADLGREVRRRDPEDGLTRRQVVRPPGSVVTPRRARAVSCAP